MRHSSARTARSSSGSSRVRSAARRVAACASSDAVDASCRSTTCRLRRASGALAPRLRSPSSAVGVASQRGGCVPGAPCDCGAARSHTLARRLSAAALQGRGRALPPGGTGRRIPRDPGRRRAHELVRPGCADGPDPDRGGRLAGRGVMRCARAVGSGSRCAARARGASRGIGDSRRTSARAGRARLPPAHGRGTRSPWRSS